MPVLIFAHDPRFKSASLDSPATKVFPQVLSETASIAALSYQKNVRSRFLKPPALRAEVTIPVFSNTFYTTAYRIKQGENFI